MSHTNIRRDLDGIPIDYYPDDFMPGWRISKSIPPSIAAKIRDDVNAAADTYFMALVSKVLKDKS